MVDAAVLETLRTFDTPTVCNALEIVAPERRAHGFSIDPFVAHDPGMAPMVGFARTATIRAKEPSGRAPSDDLGVRVGYYRHMAAGPGPTITVIEDLDRHPGFGARWGEVNSNVHKGLGSLGVITNGSIRDIDDWADGFGALAGSINPSHAWVHCVEYDLDVTVHGMDVSPGDLIHADRHGAVVVPIEVAAQISDAVAKIAAREAVLIEASQAAEFDIDALVQLLDPRGDH